MSKIKIAVLTGIGAVSLGSLTLFSRIRNFHFLLTTQLIDILLTTTAGQMMVGGVSSITLSVVVQVLLLPARSVTVTVMLCGRNDASENIWAVRIQISSEIGASTK